MKGEVKEIFSCVSEKREKHSQRSNITDTVIKLRVCTFINPLYEGLFQFLLPYFNTFVS